MKRFGLAALFVLFWAPFASSLAADGKAPPATYEMLELKPGVFHFRMQEYGSLVVVTPAGVIVVDPNGAERAQTLRKALRERTDQPVRWVNYSHAHFDHSRGGAIFKQEGARFLTNQRCVELLSRDLDEQVVAPDQTYDLTHRLELGGKTLDLHHYGVNDGQCTSIVHLPQDGVLFAVDWHLQGYVNEPYRLNQHDYVGTLNTLRRVHKELRFDTVASSHMPRSSPEQLAEDLAFNEALFAAVSKGLREGQSVEALSKSVQLPQFKHWFRYKENLPAHVGRMAFSLWHGH